MFRFILRIMLLFYFIMPFAAGFLLIQTFAEIRDDLSPIYNTASTTISNAAEDLEDGLTALSNGFQPLVNAVNSIRSVLQSVVNFLRGTVFTIIDVVNNLNPTCNFAGVACISKNFNPTIPNIVNLSFLEDISDSVSSISTQMSNVVNATTGALNAYMTTLTMAVVVFMLWIVLTGILFYVSIYKNLWQA